MYYVFILSFSILFYPILSYFRHIIHVIHLNLNLNYHLYTAVFSIHFIDTIRAYYLIKSFLHCKHYIIFFLFERLLIAFFLQVQRKLIGQSAVKNRALHLFVYFILLPVVATKTAKWQNEIQIKIQKKILSVAE